VAQSDFSRQSQQATALLRSRLLQKQEAAASDAAVAADAQKAELALHKWSAVRIIMGLVLFNITMLALFLFVGLTAPASADGATGGGSSGFLSAGLLAYTFGLRHALDADHIAAIDNVTRKLLRDGRTPLTVGLWFSLGHCTVVFIACLAVSCGYKLMQDSGTFSFADTGAALGMVFSAGVLFFIGTVNFVQGLYLIKVWKRRTRDIEGASKLAIDACSADPNSELHTHDGVLWHTHLATVDEEANVAGVGCISRCCPSLFQAIDREWKMYPLGFLFGLGFDTSSEIALLIITASNSVSASDDTFAAHFLRSMILPLLFAAGMSLLDSLDGMMMLWIYGWSMVDPFKKLFFNIFLTLTSASIALTVAGVEVAAYVQDRFDLHGMVWDHVAYISDHFEMVGVGVVLLFATSFAVAAVAFRCTFPGQQKSITESKSKLVPVKDAKESTPLFAPPTSTVTTTAGSTAPPSYGSFSGQ
jgi:high-affinity nickel-transport protein